MVTETKNGTKYLYSDNDNGIDILDCFGNGMLQQVCLKAMDFNNKYFFNK